MKMEVARNAKRNIVIGVISKVILMIFPFCVRTIVNSTLGSEYLGLNSLFSSIIQVLSLTELGFSSALIYHMHKPIADNDFDKLNAILKFYKEAYRVIGLIIIGIGIIVMPFLPRIIDGECPSDVNIYIVFGIYVFNTAISYLLFGYKQSLLVAFQRDDLNSIINLVVQLGFQISQILLLLFTRSYYFCIACMPLFTIINNFWIAIVTKKMFPLIKPSGSIEKSTIQEIKKLVLGTFVQKACGISRNSLDSICISAYLGLTLTGIYNNYYAIFNALNCVMATIINSLFGGIGNHVNLKTVEENFEELKKIDFLYMMLSGICTTCLLCLYQPFMTIWMGKDMCLHNSTIILFCAYFYLLRMGDAKYLYNAAVGLWWKLKWRAIAEAITNVALNVILGKFFGINGIIFATLISMLFSAYLCGALILFDEYFKRERFLVYLKYHLKYALVTVFVCSVTFFAVDKMISLNTNIINFVLRGCITFVISTTLYFFVYFKTSIFKDSIKMIKR